MGERSGLGRGPLQALGTDVYSYLEKQLASRLPEGHAQPRTGGGPTQLRQKPREATHTVSASLPLLLIPSAELMSSGRLLSAAMDFVCAPVRTWALQGVRKHVTCGLWPQ